MAQAWSVRAIKREEKRGSMEGHFTLSFVGELFHTNCIYWLSCVVIQVRVVFRKNVVGDRCFYHLSGSHLQSQAKSLGQMMVFMLSVIWSDKGLILEMSANTLFTAFSVSTSNLMLIHCMFYQHAITDQN